MRMRENIFMDDMVKNTEYIDRCERRRPVVRHDAFFFVTLARSWMLPSPDLD